MTTNKHGPPGSRQQLMHANRGAPRPPGNEPPPAPPRGEREKSHQLAVFTGGEKGRKILFRGNSTIGGEWERYVLNDD